MNIHKDINQLGLVGIDRQAYMRVSKESLTLSEDECIPSFGDAYHDSELCQRPEAERYKTHVHH